MKVIPDGQSHPDCASFRQQAASLCPKPIGFDVHMYVDPENNEALVHAICLEDLEGVH